jgi:hypothetical protein
MTDQARVDWLLSYLERHANDPKRPTAAYQPSLYDALAGEDDDDQEVPRWTSRPTGT